MEQQYTKEMNNKLLAGIHFSDDNYFRRQTLNKVNY